MQTLRAKSSRDWNVWFAMIFAKGVGFGQIADRARWRIRLPLSLGSRLGHLDGFGSDSLYAFMRVWHTVMMRLPSLRFKGTECPQSLSQRGETYFAFATDGLFLNSARSLLMRFGLVRGSQLRPMHRNSCFSSPFKPRRRASLSRWGSFSAAFIRSARFSARAEP